MNKNGYESGHPQQYVALIEFYPKKSYFDVIVLVYNPPGNSSEDVAI